VSVFVTGTDTGVGKTSFTVWLLRRLVERGVRCAGYKPICCGDRDDALQLQAASSSGLTIEEVNPVWLRSPVAPLTAAREEDRIIDLSALRDGFVRLEERFDFVAVEGVGGWMVPITPNYFSNDLAAELDLRVIVVAQNRLGCLNHTFLTVRAIEAAGLNCAGVILNHLTPGTDLAVTTNAEVLRSCLSAPVLERFEPDSTAIPASLRKMIPELSDLA
jgi:dethiobiotin synthetase